MYRQAGQAGAVGIEVFLAILVGYYAGHWLDAKLDTSPWFTYFLGLAGVGAAVKALVRITKKYKQDLAAQDLATRERQQAAPKTPDERTPSPRD